MPMIGRSGVWVLVCAALVCSAPLRAAEIQTFGTGSKVVRHATLPLQPAQKRGFRDLSKQGYFGAIAVHERKDEYVSFFHFYSIATARQLAVEGCKVLIPDDPDGCVLYASILPRSLPAATNAAEGLSERALKERDGRYAKKAKPGRWRAFAISDMSDFGVAWDQPSKAEATGVALAQCEAAASHEIAGFPNATRAKIRAAGLAKCRVIDARSP